MACRSLPIPLEPEVQEPWTRTEFQFRLTKLECEFAAIGGIHRRIESLFAGDRKDCYAKSSGDQYWDRDIEAYAAEMVIAKHLNCYQEPKVRDFDCQDIGKHIGVRHTTYRDGRLIIRPNDKPGLYVLVIGRMPVFTIAGCFSSVLARRKYKPDASKPGEPAIFIPQSDLHPFPPRSQWRGKVNPLVLYLEPEYWENHGSN